MFTSPTPGSEVPQWRLGQAGQSPAAVGKVGKRRRPWGEASWRGGASAACRPGHRRAQVYAPRGEPLEAARGGPLGPPLRPPRAGPWRCSTLCPGANHPDPASVESARSVVSPCLFNLGAEYTMRNAGLDEAQTGIKIAGRNINNLR